MKLLLATVLASVPVLPLADSCYGQAPSVPRRVVPPQLLKRFDADGDGKLNERESATLREEGAKRRTAGNAPPAPLPEGTKTYGNLRYGPHEERNILDLYVPKAGEKPYPLVIWIHGGGWRNGSKESARPALPLLGEGFAVATINYRLSGHAVFPAQIEDCKAAIRFLRANSAKYGLDPDRFGVMGSSAGGHLVALVGTSGGVSDLEGNVGDHDDVSSRVQAVCDWYGPTDFLQMGGGHNNADSPESLLLGGAIQEHKDRAARANPITYATGDDPPFLIMHGTRDPAVPYGQSELLDAALRKTGVSATLVPIEGAGHGGPEFQTPEVRDRVVAFFRRQLQVAPQAK